MRVVDQRTAIGGVAEIGYSTPEGSPGRVALTARWRRQFIDNAVDVGAGPLIVGVHPHGQYGIGGRANAYGATVETVLLFRGYAGLTAGADLVHRAGWGMVTSATR